MHVLLNSCLSAGAGTCLGQGGFCQTPAALRHLRLREFEEASAVSPAELLGSHRRVEGAPWWAVTLAEGLTNCTGSNPDRARLPSDDLGCSDLWPAPFFGWQWVLLGVTATDSKMSDLSLWTKVQVGWLVFLKHGPPAFGAVTNPTLPFKILIEG